MMHIVRDYPWQPSMPSVCYLCGAAPRTDGEYPSGEPIVATGKWIEMEGQLHICAHCVGDAARLIGFIDPATASARFTEIARLRELLTGVEREVDQLRSANITLASGILEQTFASAADAQ